MTEEEKRALEEQAKIFGEPLCEVCDGRGSYWNELLQEQRKCPCQENWKP